MENKKFNVVVIGAGNTVYIIFYSFLNLLMKSILGVIGLSTASSFLEDENLFKVHLVANHFPGDSSIEYTSPS